MTRLMYVPTHEVAGEDGTRHRVISQLEGYETLEELDWDAYAQAHEHPAHGPHPQGRG